MKYFVISDSNDTLEGMRLAGIEGRLVEAGERKTVREAVSESMKDPEIGILMITEKLAKICPELIAEMKLKNSGTLVVEIPDRHGTGRDPDSITRYIREAIGIKI